MRHAFTLWRWFWWLGSHASPLPVLAIGATVLFGIQLFRTIHDVDIFWQVKLGEITLDHGLPTHEPLLAGKGHEPFVSVCWLSQVVDAVVRRIGGWPLLRVFDAAVWFSGFLLVAWHCARKQGKDWPALAGLFIGWLAAIPHASLRPQSFAVLCFGLLIVILDSPLRRKWLWCLIVFLFWQNLHPSLVIAVGYIGAQLLSYLPSLFGRGKRGYGSIEIKQLLILLFLAIVCMFATPMHYHIFAVSRYNEEISKFRGITEWMPMWEYDLTGYGREYTWPAFDLAAIVLILAIYLRGVKLGDLLALLGLTVVSLLMHRFSLFWGVAVIPLVAGVLARLGIPQDPMATPQRKPGREIARLRTIFTGLATFVAMGLMMFSPCTFAYYYPFAAVDAMKHHTFHGPVYCNYFWGGVLADAGYSVTYDGRYYLFTKDEWIRYGAASRGEIGLEEIIAQHRPVAFVLDKESDGGLIAMLRPRWRVLHEDKLAVVFVP